MECLDLILHLILHLRRGRGPTTLEVLVLRLSHASPLFRIDRPSPPPFICGSTNPSLVRSRFARCSYAPFLLVRFFAVATMYAQTCLGDEGVCAGRFRITPTEPDYGFSKSVATATSKTNYFVRRNDRASAYPWRRAEKWNRYSRRHGARSRTESLISCVPHDETGKP
jgi:hypothetical protein